MTDSRSEGRLAVIEIHTVSTGKKYVTPCIENCYPNRQHEETIAPSVITNLRSEGRCRL